MTPKEFIQSIVTWPSFKEKIGLYLTDTVSDMDLKPFKLPKFMSDTEIQKEAKSSPIPVEVFASVLQKFIATASKEDWYIFHVQTPDGVVAVDLSWRGARWDSRACRFDDVYGWHEGNIFLSSAG